MLMRDFELLLKKRDEFYSSLQKKNLFYNKN